MKGRKPSLTSLVAFFLIVTPLAYFLSYAPVFRVSVEDTSRIRRENWQEWYRPVEWLTDNTLLREPLLFWAGLWGEYVESDFRLRSDRRMRGEDPYRPTTRGGGGAFF